MKKFLKVSLQLFGGVLLAAALWLLAGVLWPLATPLARQAPDRLLITDTILVDVRAGVLSPNQDILVENGEIIAVGDDLEPGDARLLQARGQFVIPGFLSTHVGMMDGIGERSLISVAIGSHFIGGLCVSLFGHLLFVLLG